MTKKPTSPSSSSPVRPLSQIVEGTSKRVKVDEDNYDRFAKRTQVPSRTEVPAPAPAPPVTEPAPLATATSEAEAVDAARAELAGFDADAPPRARRNSRISERIAALELGPSGAGELPAMPPGATPPEDDDLELAAPAPAPAAPPAPSAGTQVLVGFSAPGLAVPPVDASDLATPGSPSTMMLVGFSAPGIAVPAATPAASPGTQVLGAGYAPPGIAAPAGGDDLVGRELAGYVIKQKLAEGGMGIVYLAEHSKIGRKSAIKVLKLDYCTNTEVVERFLQEARSVNEIRHENIVDIYDVGRDSAGRAFFVMELLEGESLAKRLERGPLAWDEALPVLDQTLRALAAAHAKGFTHRDLKPDNIWLGTKSGGGVQAKLLDFGIAKLRSPSGEDGSPQDKLTKTGTVMGTPDYMSPEQINGADSIDRRADLYSMGCIIYELFKGEPPFAGKSLQATMSGHLFKEPPRLTDVPAALGVPAGVADVVTVLLAKQPGDRYDTAAELLADLRALGGGTATSMTLQSRLAAIKQAAEVAVEARRAPPTQIEPAPRKRSWLGPAMALGLAAAGVGIYATRGGGTRAAAPLVTDAGSGSAGSGSGGVVSNAPPPVDYTKVRDDALALLRNSLQATTPRDRVLGTVALGSAHDRASIPALLVLATQDPDDEVRGHAAASLAELDGIEDVAMLSAAEAKASAPLKVWFAAAAARIGDKAATKRLAGYAGSPDLAVAFKAGLAYADISAPGDKGALAALTTLSGREAELNQIAPYSGAVILSQMARLRHAKARKVLYGLLAESDENARLAAAMGLAKIGDDGGKEVLTQTMADKASPNRVAAAAGLVELGDYSGFALLQETLTAGDADARAQAADALGKIGEKESVRPLLALLEAKEPAVKIAAAAALLAVVAIDPVVLAQEAVDWTGSALASTDFKVRTSGASVIGDLPVKAALPLLAKAIADTEVPVRKAAATSAGKLRDREVASQLVAAVGTEGDASTKEAMVRSLGLIGDAIARDALLSLAADSGRLGVLASGSLIAMGDTAAVARLESDIRGGSRDIKLAVVDASVIARNRVVVPVLTTGNGDRDATVAFASAEALTGYDERGAAVLTTLQTAAASKDVGLQARAIAALGRIGVSAPGVTLDPAAMLDAADPAVRLAALAVIGTLPWATAKPLLRRASGDPSVDVRRGVADTLARFVTSDQDDVVKQFKVLIDDRDAPVRTVAQAQLAKLVKPLAQPDAPRAGATTAAVPPPVPPAPTVDLAPLQAAATSAEAAATATAKARDAFDAKAKLIEAAISKPAADDDAIDAVAALGKELATLAEEVARAAAPAQAAQAATAGAPPDGKALVDRIQAASAAAAASAKPVATRASELKRKVADYVAADAGDPDMYLATADAALATGKLGEARKNLDLASKGYKQTKTSNPGLFWSYGQLWDRMAQKEGDPAKRRGLLTKAKQAFDSFASKGSGTRANQARERSDEIKEELAATP